MFVKDQHNERCATTYRQTLVTLSLVGLVAGCSQAVESSPTDVAATSQQAEFRNCRNERQLVRTYVSRSDFGDDFKRADAALEQCLERDFLLSQVDEYYGVSGCDFEQLQFDLDQGTSKRVTVWDLKGCGMMVWKIRLQPLRSHMTRLYKAGEQLLVANLDAGEVSVKEIRVLDTAEAMPTDVLRPWHALLFGDGRGIGAAADWQVRLEAGNSPVEFFLAHPHTTCDGVPTDVRNDEDNCGACGRTCDPGIPCMAGECQFTNASF